MKSDTVKSVDATSGVHVYMKRVMQFGVTSLLFLVLLSSCGFQLRGAYKLPSAMQVTYVDAVQKNSGLTRALIRSLKVSGISIADSAADDIAVLKLSQETRAKRIVSVDANGRAREYTLTYAISFQVKAVDSQFEIENQSINIDRDFQFDTQDVLGNSREESQLYEEMQQDLIRLILLRLESKS